MRSAKCTVHAQIGSPRVPRAQELWSVGLSMRRCILVYCSVLFDNKLKGGDNIDSRGRLAEVFTIFQESMHILIHQ